MFYRIDLRVFFFFFDDSIRCADETFNEKKIQKLINYKYLLIKLDINQIDKFKQVAFVPKTSDGNGLIIFVICYYSDFNIIL